MAQGTRFLDDAAECVNAVLERHAGHIVLGLPIGIGKANPVVNEFYRRASRDRGISLKIFTGLSLGRPGWHSELERRLVEPLSQRLFGGHLELDYLRDLRAGTVPPNIEITEFFMQPGAALNISHAQRHYISSNYTHVARDLLTAGVNVVAQLVARQGTEPKARYSLGSNPDVTVDLLRVVDRAKFSLVGAVNGQMPFMYGDAAIETGAFDFILDHPRYEYELFAPPNESLGTADHAIGLHAAALVRDGGTLQLGIGALGDAVAYALQLRHQRNEEFRDMLRSLHILERFSAQMSLGGEGVFAEGLYGCSEMLMDGFLDLYRSGVLKRRVYGNLPLQQLLHQRRITERIDAAMLEALAGCMSGPLDEAQFRSLQDAGLFRRDCRYLDGQVINSDGERCDARFDDAKVRDALLRRYTARQLSGGVLAHGGFLLGPRGFYAALRDMPDAERRLFPMCAISFINDLHGEHAALKIAQRRDARFINSTMMVTLLGASTADALADGRVVSGVGGQYNFVAMAHALPGARSILALRATRLDSAGRLQSNVLWNYGHTTIPRHLRDIVITEYGIADLRGRTDEQVIKAMLAVTDSRFQEALRQQAVAAGKLAADYRIPEEHRSNQPDALERRFALPRARGLFTEFPAGTELTQEEISLVKALTRLQRSTSSRGAALLAALRAMSDFHTPAALNPALARMDLLEPRSRREWLWQRLLVRELRKSA